MVHKSLGDIRAEGQKAIMRGAPLQIVGRHDLMSETESLEYSVVTRLGKLYLSGGCCANTPGVIRLFQDIDPGVRRIEVFSGKRLDTVLERPKGDWTVATIDE